MVKRYLHAATDGDDAIDIVHVGSASRDLADDDSRGWRLGGGVTYSALMTARLGLRTAALVGADGLAAGATELDLLRSAGVEVRVLPLGRGPVFRNLERPEGRIQLCVEPGEPLPPVALPARWRRATTWMILPVAGETGPEWAAAIPGAARMGLAWQGLLRRLVRGETVTRRPAAFSPLLVRADVIGVSHHDLPPGTGPTALARFLRPGSRLLITRGRDGGVLAPVAGDGGTADEIEYDAVPAATELDPTGAGDVFLAAFIAKVIEPAQASQGPVLGDLPLEVVRTALRYAAAAGSLVVEGPGLLGVPTRPAIEQRLVESGR